MMAILCFLNCSKVRRGRSLADLGATFQELERLGVGFVSMPASNSSAKGPTPCGSCIASASAKPKSLLGCRSVVH